MSLTIGESAQELERNRVSALENRSALLWAMARLPAGAEIMRRLMSDPENQGAVVDALRSMPITARLREEDEQKVVERRGLR